MKKLDKRGGTALEFCLVAVPLFILMFAIIDFGRYVITMQSVRALANAGTRAMMINCYTPRLINPTAPTQSPADCTSDPLPLSAKDAVAPFLTTPTLQVTASGNKAAGGTLLVTASDPGFAMIVRLWGSTFNTPSASTSVPFPPS